MEKTQIKVLSLLLAVLLFATSLVSCGNMGALTIFKNGESKYRIVYENGNREAGTAAERIATMLGKKAEVEIEVTDDRTEADKKIPEILVGRTNRGTELEAQRTLRYGSYRVVREKKNVYILGAGDGILTRACEDFVNGLLEAGGKISGKGELLASEKKYSVDTVTLNGRPLTDHTVYVPEKSDVDFEAYVEYVEAQLISSSGFMLTVKTYTDIGEIPDKKPALVLKKDTSLSARGYAVTRASENVLHLAIGSNAAAISVAAALIERIDAKAGGTMELTLAEENGAVGESELVPLRGEADLRVMAFNVYGNDEHKKLMPYVTGTSLAYAADFICMQEFYDVAYETVGKDLEAAGYSAVGTTFTEISPTALEHTEDPSAQKFTYVGGACNTPIYYRASDWDVVESGAYLFYWMNRWHCSNTKSLAYGVFRNKTTGEQVAIISTHFPLMGDNYKSTIKDGRDYSTYTDKKEGAEWRYGAALEILKQVDALRAKYPGILTVVGGDLNAQAAEKSVQTIEAHAALSNGSVMAPADAMDLGGSFHNYGEAPGTKSMPIDHLFVTEDVATVTCHRIVTDPLTVQGTDHSPVVLDIARK